jgi:threonine/homoserine/homoserine lactone efflux protein
MESILACLALLLPLTLSPGPATIALAGLGMNRGIVRSMPFFSGLLISAFGIAVASGMGLNAVFLAYPTAYQILRYAGICYIFYLAWKFLRARPSISDSADGEFRVLDGMLLTVLNPKFYLVVTVLFSQFLKPGQGALWAVIFGLTAVLAVSQFVWLAAGAAIKPLLKSETALRIQSRVFGVLLLLVAAFMLLRPG